MLVLGPRNRAAFALAAFAAFAGAFLRAPSSAGGARSDPRPVAPVRRPAPAPGTSALVPRRDPFAEPPDATPGAPAAPDATAALRVPPVLGVLPPNAGAPPLPFPLPVRPAPPAPFRPPAPAARALVAAVASGPRPVALVVEAGATRLVGIGDRVGASTIAAIAPDGLRLADGTLLRIAPAPAHGGL
jgi:hypothetical protein